MPKHHYPSDNSPNRDLGNPGSRSPRPGSRSPRFGHHKKHSSGTEEHKSGEKHPELQHHPSIDHTWAYDGRFGIDHWNDFCSTLSKHDGGHRQSPIDLRLSDVIHHKDLIPIKIKGFEDTKQDITIKNNGHTTNVDLKDCHYELSEGHLSDTYESVQMHLHWGSDSSQGSEHTIDGKQYAAELHVVHKHVIPQLQRSKKHHKGKDLAVLGFLIESSAEDNPAWENFLSYLPKISNQGMETKISELNLRPMLPNDLNHFFRYHGSLTTPPCYQTVNWTVYRDTIKLSERQLDMFRKNLKHNIYGEEEHALVNNYRPIQPIDGRKVHTTWEI